MSLLEEIISINKKINEINPEVQTMVPCFYGTSGTGKSTRARSYAKQVGLKLETILLHSMLSEEVCGLPRYNPETNTTVWTLPEWFDPNEPKVYLFDELDKVKEDELGLLLTMFASKEIRGIPFPKDSVIICAMQPIVPELWTETETGQALISRLLFIPIGNGNAFKYVEEKYNINLNFMPDSTVSVPILAAPNPRQVEYFLNVSAVAGIDKAEEICRYMINEKFIAALKDATVSTFGIDKKKFIQRLNETPEKISKFDYYQILENIGEIWHYGNSELISEAMYKLIYEGTFDEYEKLVSKLYNYFDNIMKDGETLEIANGDDEDKFYEVFKSKMDKLAKALKRRDAKEDSKESKVPEGNNS